jgi:hypothetical protein
MSSSRIIKLAVSDGSIRAINMRNVISITHKARELIIKYNVNDYNSGGFLIFSCGFHNGYTAPYTETLTNQTESDAAKVFHNLTGDAELT